MATDPFCMTVSTNPDECCHLQMEKLQGTTTRPEAVVDTNEDHFIITPCLLRLGYLRSSEAKNREARRSADGSTCQTGVAGYNGSSMTADQSSGSTADGKI